MYGVEFSPSGAILYITHEFFADIIQYNLTAANIPASAITVLDTDPLGTGGSLQLAPDGKIYKACNSTEFLTVIQNPDVVGMGCNAQSNALHLGGRISMHGLPNFIQSFFSMGIRAEHLCFDDATAFSLISPVAPDTITWDFGDGAASVQAEAVHTYNSPGNYSVSATIVLEGAQRVITKNITIRPLPAAVAPPNLTACDGNEGNEVFNLSEHQAVILGGQDPLSYSVTYHALQQDAEDNTNGLPANYTNISNPQMIYARVTDNASGCYAITSFSLNVAALPEIEMDGEYAFCKGNVFNLSAPAGFDAYEWSTGELTRSITIAAAGDYTVTVFEDHDGQLCSASKTITVTVSEAPVIRDIKVEDWTDNRNHITVITQDAGDYEYSLDNETWQPGSEFDNLLPGLYTVHVRERNGCGADEEEVVLLMYPKFFTPNGDGHNDAWQVKYAYFEPGVLVHIFDRYGKVVASFRGTSFGWDGKFNGADLPSTDYWFVVERQDGRMHRGHFSMLR